MASKFGSINTNEDFYLLNITTSTITINASNTTGVVNVFTLSGAVQVLRLYGEVKTQLGNHTGAYFRINDVATDSPLTLVVGVGLNNYNIGSIIYRYEDALSALEGLKSDQVRGSNEATHGYVFHPFMIGAGSGVTTVQYVYVTTDSPTVGSIKMTAHWLPVSSSGDLI